jgi:hypothetical protein
MADEEPREEQPQGRDRHARWKPGASLPFGRFWWKDWLGDPAVRRLTHEQRGRLMDVRAATYGSSTLGMTPGVMTEEDVRAWAGYTPEEWKRVREDFSRAFTMRGRTHKRWVLVDIEEDYAASSRIARAAYLRAMKGVAGRKKGKDLATTGSTPGTTQAQPRVQPQLDTDVRSQNSEIQKADKSEPDSRAPRAQMRSRAGSAGPAGSSGASPLRGIIARATEGNGGSERGSA